MYNCVYSFEALRANFVSLKKKRHRRIQLQQVLINEVSTSYFSYKDYYFLFFFFFFMKPDLGHSKLRRHSWPPFPLIGSSVSAQTPGDGGEPFSSVCGLCRKLYCGISIGFCRPSIHDFYSGLWGHENKVWLFCNHRFKVRLL